MGSSRGRLAPTPTGYLHLGHARTFWVAQERVRREGGVLVLRNEDLDHDRCKPEFVRAMFDDLRWFGLNWAEGPDCGGPFGPYTQSERLARYRSAFQQLQQGGWVYPCRCSRKDILQALLAPHENEADEPVYPGTCRPGVDAAARRPAAALPRDQRDAASRGPRSAVNWRFRVPEGEAVAFVDQRAGPQAFAAGRDFGDFVVWRHDDLPSYQLAVVVDDHAMQISEVVRGEDLLRSTARQLLLYAALGWAPPAFYHCPLLRDENGVRLAKRHAALSLGALRARGLTPQALRQGWSA